MEVWLPVCPAPADEIPLIPGPGFAREEKSILVIDDDIDLAVTAGDILEHLGFSATIVHGGPAALEWMRVSPSPPSLVILDMVMPEMDGAETFRRIRDLQSQQKILLCSGYSQDGVLGELLATGNCYFLPKPYEIQDLEQAVHRALDIPQG